MLLILGIGITGETRGEQMDLIFYGYFPIAYEYPLRIWYTVVLSSALVRDLQLTMRHSLIVFYLF